MPSKYKALPGQIRAIGVIKNNEPSLEYVAGEGVTQAQLDAVKSFLEEPVYTILTKMSCPRPPSPPLFLELVSRGADAKSFRFSIFTAQAKPHVKAKRLRIVPGKLRLAYSAIPHEGVDMATLWAMPFSRRESSLLLSQLSVGALRAQDRHKLMEQLNPVTSFVSWGTIFKENGLRYESLDLYVKHKDPAPVDN